MTGPIPDELARQIAAVVMTDGAGRAGLDFHLHRAARTAELLSRTADADLYSDDAVTLRAYELAPVLDLLWQDLRVSLAVLERMEPHP